MTETVTSPSAILLSIDVNVTDWSIFQFDAVNVNDDFDIEILELLFELMLKVTFDVGCDFNLNDLVIDCPSFKVTDVLSYIIPARSSSLIVIGIMLPGT